MAHTDIRSAHLRVRGMRCAGCEETIEHAVGQLPGVRKVSADHARQTVDIEFDDAPIRDAAIRRAIEGAGCEPDSPSVLPSAHGARPTLIFLSFLLAIGGVTVWGRSMVPDLVGEMSPNLGYAMLVSIGFLTGFHCIGMCGGFVAGYASAVEPRTAASIATAHLMYAAGKTASYTLIGGSLGMLGSLLAFTPAMRGTVTLAASLFVIVYGLKMLNVFAGLRRFTLRLPRFVTGNVSNRLRQPRRPLTIGLLNGLMLGCGPLQAMYVMAAGTGSAQEGATMLCLFGLGTLVPLLGFGLVASTVSRSTIDLLVRASAVMVIAMGLMMADRGLRLTGSGYDAASLLSRLPHAAPAQALPEGEAVHRVGWDAFPHAGLPALHRS